MMFGPIKNPKFGSMSSDSGQGMGQNTDLKASLKLSSMLAAKKDQTPTSPLVTALKKKRKGTQ